MKIAKEDLIGVLSQFNPWWRKENISDLPSWRRVAYYELMTWIENPPAMRAVMLSGARQVGKTTILLQAIDNLISSGVSPSSILYVTFDHPILKLAGLEAVLEAWRDIEPKKPGLEYLFLDEVQFVKDFGTWVKHQVDFFKQRKIFFTGSAMPLVKSVQESGVGRWHTLRISTLSFYEYLQIKKIVHPKIYSVNNLPELFQNKSTADFLRITESAQALTGHFHEYLVRGGFPQTALIESITQSQRLLREDIIDKVLKRDMTALFGVRRIIELEQMFIYLCMHDGGQQDITTMSRDLGLAKATVQNYLDLFESVHLVFRLPPYGYGKEVLRGRFKYYLVDAAIAPAILMKGKTVLEDAEALGTCAETTIMAHLSSYSYTNQARFSYWRSHKEKEVDLVIEMGGQILPFEVKYQSQTVQRDSIPGLIDLCREKRSIDRGYVLTKLPNDTGPLINKEDSTPIMKIPASLFCYWLGESEIQQKNIIM
jgi:predicted AAA+ superfamily ATPase